METATADQEPEQAPQPALPQASVFVSYSRGDQKRAMPVIAGLEKAGFRVWWDGLLEGGDTFLPTTEAALEGAEVVVVIWSKTSLASNWVRDEATVGRDRRRLVPLSLNGSEAPLGFRQFQVIDIAKWRGNPVCIEFTIHPGGTGIFDLRRGRLSRLLRQRRPAGQRGAKCK